MNLPGGNDHFTHANRRDTILLTQEYIRTRLASFRREGNIEEIQIALLTGTNGTEGEHISIQKWQRQPSGEVLATDERVWIEPWEIPALIAALESARADHQGRPEGVTA